MSNGHKHKIVGDVEFVDIPNSLSLDKSGIREYFGNLVREEHRNEIIILDEVDTIFSHRFWQNRQQSERILDAFQDEKLNLLIISTSHQGKGFDLILRDACRLIFVTDYSHFTGLTKVTFGYTDCDLKGEFTVDVRAIFPHYHRWSVVKDTGGLIVPSQSSSLPVDSNHMIDISGDQIRFVE
jgi:hypothetical protein